MRKCTSCSRALNAISYWPQHSSVTPSKRTYRSSRRKSAHLNEIVREAELDESVAIHPIIVEQQRQWPEHSYCSRMTQT